MKKLLPLFLLILIGCSSNKTVSKIEKYQSIQVDFPNYTAYTVKVKNTSFKPVEVKILNKVTNDFVRGFGLSGLGSAEVQVEKENYIQVTNLKNKSAKVKVKVTKSVSIAAMPLATKTKTISFTLENKTDQSIPLIIPSVMNPNLSPFSKSGVDLRIGQQIFFKNKGKKYLLLTVDNSIKDDYILDVAELLKLRKKELGLD